MRRFSSKTARAASHLASEENSLNTNENHHPDKIMPARTTKPIKCAGIVRKLHLKTIFPRIVHLKKYTIYFLYVQVIWDKDPLRSSLCCARMKMNHWFLLGQW